MNNFKKAEEPFLAYCKQHNDRAVINSRKHNYTLMMTNYKTKKHNDKRLFESYPDRVITINL